MCPMDSKLIYNSAKRYKFKVSWDKYGNDEWAYLGDSKEAKLDFASKLILEFFTNENLFVAHTRTESFETTNRGTLDWYGII